MKTTIPKDQKAVFWQQHIELANQYPSGIQKYCEANGLASQTFYKWRLKINSKPNKKLATLKPTNPFAVVQVSKPEVSRKQGLPDAKWLAEFILHLAEVAQ